MLYFVGAPKISAWGHRMVKMVNVTPLSVVTWVVFSSTIIGLTKSFPEQVRETHRHVDSCLSLRAYLRV